MKNVRKGLGKGLGMGYKNLVIRDPMVHSLSARGVKTYENIKMKLRQGTFDKFGHTLWIDVMDMKDDLSYEFFKKPYNELDDGQKDEVDEAYREKVFKLSAKGTRELMRKGFNTVLAIKINGVTMKANVKIDRLNPEDIIGVPDIVMKDKKGSMVKWVSIDNATGKIIGEGLEGSKFSRVLMNDKGQIIPKDQIEYYQKTGENKFVKIQPFESNIGKNRQISIDKVIPKDESDNYLFESTYQLVGQTEDDDNDLYQISKYLYDKGLVGVIPVIFRQGFKKDFGLITPELSKDRFSVIVRMTRAKIEPTKMNVPSGKEQKKEKLPTVKVKEVF